MTQHSTDVAWITSSGPTARSPTPPRRGTWSAQLWLSIFRLREGVDELRPPGRTAPRSSPTSRAAR